MPRRIRPPARRPRAETLESRALLAAFVVTSAADSGAGSLRAAITGADADASPASTRSPSPSRARRADDRPDHGPADVTRPVSIDGTSQPGYVARAPGRWSRSTAKAVPSFSPGLILSGGSTVRGLAIDDFTSSYGIQLIGATGGNLIEGNYLGIAPDGVTAMPNTRGIEVDSPDNTIGGTTLAARNVISGNIDGGSFASTPATTPGNIIEGNFIGTDASGGRRPSATTWASS